MRQLIGKSYYEYEVIMALQVIRVIEQGPDFMCSDKIRLIRSQAAA